MTLHIIPEQIVPGKRLGRHIHSPAERAAQRAAAGAPPLASELVSVRHASSPNMPLNQGDTSACTAHAETGALNTVPHWKQGQTALSQAQVWPLYSAEEEILFDSPYPPTDNGGSGQAVNQAAERLGYVSGFQVAEGIREALLALMLRPVITGVNWYDSFDNPPASGLVSIAPGASVRGGHEFVRDEIRVPAGVTIANMMDNLDLIEVWGWNSWGAGWAVGGRFGMTAATWNSLLYQSGDVTVPRTAPGWVAP